MEIVVLPEVTYILTSDVHAYVRRVFTDGRAWPQNIEPAFQGGLSLGKWTDADPDGRYHTLEIETRGFKGPRVYDDSGIPLHADNESVIKERLYLDKADRNLLHNDITVFDHALTRPWAVAKTYRRNANPRPALGGVGMRGGTGPCADRQGGLFPERRRAPDARQEGSGAARPEIFQSIAKVAAAAKTWMPATSAGMTGGEAMEATLGATAT